MKSMYEIEQMLKKEAYLKKTNKMGYLKMVNPEAYQAKVKAHKLARDAYEANRLDGLKVVKKVGTIPTAYDTAMARAFAKAGYTK